MSHERYFKAACGGPYFGRVSPMCSGKHPKKDLDLWGMYPQGENA